MTSLKTTLLLLAFTMPLAAQEFGNIDVATLSIDKKILEEKPTLTFSWKIKAEGRGQLQAGYRILLSTKEEELKPNGDLVWDSDTVKSFQSTRVSYDGPELAPEQTYYWKVQLKNAEDKFGKWSEPAHFTLQESKDETTPSKAEVTSISRFHCSDKTLNQLFSSSVKARKQSLTTPPSFEPSELPLGTTLQLTARGFALEADLASYYRQLLEDVLSDSQKIKTSLTPSSNENNSLPSSEFSTAGLMIPFALWQLNGDISITKQFFDPAVAHVAALRKNDPLFEGKAFASHNKDFGHQEDPTSADFLSMCLFAMNCRILGEMAMAVNHLPYIIQHRAWFDNLKKGFETSFLDENGQLTEKSQTAQILALRFGLLPQEAKQPVADALAARLKKEGLKAGIFGQSTVLPVLSWTNHHEQAVSLAKSYGAEDAKPSVVALATTSEWMMSFLAGFIHQAPGFKTSRISPFIPTDGSITEVKAHHETPYGRLAIHWKTTETGLTAEVTIPPNTTGIISLPGDEKATVTEGGKSLKEAFGCQFMRDLNGRKEIIAQSGTYRFEVKNGAVE